jgi:hypothetical protein
MMRAMRVAKRLGAALVVPSLLFVFTRCSDVTELVVVVDTDLTAGTDVGRIDVEVQNGSPPSKGADIKRAADLPLTLGVTAGSNESAEVVVVATAKLGSKDVARTRVTAKMVAGESRLVHISLCRECGLDCRRSYGTDTPAYEANEPRAPACASFVPPSGADGGPDANVNPNDAGEDAPDGDVITPDGGDSCGAGCPAGSTCQGANGCHVDTEPTCGTTIKVTSPNITFNGQICPTKGTAIHLCEGKTPDLTKAHVFENASTGTLKAQITYAQDTLRFNAVTDGSCASIPSNGCAVGGTPTKSIVANGLVGIGLDDNANCVLYKVRFTP